MPKLKTTAVMKGILTIFSVLVFSQLFGQNLMMNNQGVLKANIETFKEEIEILNEDGTVWMKFDFDFESKLSEKSSYTIDDIKELYNWQEDFNPYAFKIDYALLLFNCVGQENGKYKIIVNEKSGETKFIEKKQYLVLENWATHIENSVVSIDFDRKENPIKTQPNQDSEEIKIAGEIDPVLEPIKIQSDWLKFRFWENDEEKTGWIKWKEKNMIIIKLYYLI
jgi:hypothetical protein